MGSTIYTQKLRHPVTVSYLCEHCGHYNLFSQDIVGSGSTEVSNIRGNKFRQDQVNKLGSKAENDLLRKISNVRYLVESGNYSWLKFHKCVNCSYTQSWQTGRLWKRSVKFFVLDFFIFLIFYSWLTGSSSEVKTTGAWVFFAILGLFVLIPIFVLIKSLRKCDKEHRNKPDIRI